ncbi:hypothetical protein FOZ63_005359, partial [Perkinsus olseni]
SDGDRHRLADTSPVHSHGPEYHHRVDAAAAAGDLDHQHRHGPSKAPTITPSKKVPPKEESGHPKDPTKPTSGLTPPTSAAAVDPFTMALLRGASPEPPTNKDSSAGPFGTANFSRSFYGEEYSCAAAEPSSSLFGDAPGSDSLFGPPLDHDGGPAFTEGPASSSGSRFARLFETLHADEPKTTPPATTAGVQSSSFPSAIPGPFSTTSAASPFAPVPGSGSSSLFGGLPSAAPAAAQVPSSIFGAPPVVPTGPDRQSSAPKVPTAPSAQPASASATQAQLQHALLQQLRAAPPATTAKVQQILERASSNASSQGGGGVPALLHQLQAQAQQKREQAEQQARAMAAAASQQQQQQAALVRLQQMQVQQQMKKLLQEQQQEARPAQYGGPSSTVSGMSALNRLISAGSSSSHHGAPPTGVHTPTSGSAPVGTPSPGLDVNALFWTYLDPHGHKQGPFSNAQMK